MTRHECIAVAYDNLRDARTCIGHYNRRVGTRAAAVPSAIAIDARRSIFHYLEEAARCRRLARRSAGMVRLAANGNAGALAPALAA
jgi:hypothetical protein